MSPGQSHSRAPQYVRGRQPHLSHERTEGQHLGSLDQIGGKSHGLQRKRAGLIAGPIFVVLDIEADTAAWVMSTGPAPTNTATTMASTTIRAIWGIPVPIASTNTSAIVTPTTTPAVTSRARLGSCPRTAPKTITAEMAAKIGTAWPSA